MENKVRLYRASPYSEDLRVWLPNAYFTTDTIVYAAGGYGAVVSDDGKTRQELSPGDFALIPAWTEHQEVNVGIGGEPISYFRLSHNTSPETICPLPKRLNRVIADSPVT
jgi:hypothetical protein